MKNFCVFVLLGIIKVAPIFATIGEPPVLKLYEVDDSNNVVRLYDRADDKSTGIIIDNLDHLRLECQASYPVKLTYTGNGNPLLSSTTQENTQYIASAFLRSLNERHTGSYQCSHTESVNPPSLLHIFVPGQNLFTSVEGETIEVPNTDDSVLIPCTVSHPRVQVSLEKSTREGLKKPVTKSDDAIIYTPRKGFRINLNEVVDPEGTYVCKAHYNNIVRSVDYKVVFARAPPNLSAFEQRPEETCKGESCASHCETHSDCPPMMNCYADLLCRNPCTYSINCGKESLCRLIDRVPKCYCPPGFVGDANKECFQR